MEREPGIDRRNPLGAARPLRVFLVDDRGLIRRAIAGLLAEDGEFEVCGESGNVDDALDRIGASAPDLLILAVSVGAEEGWRLLRSVSVENEVPILILSARNDPFYAERALGAGASGYVLEQEPVDKFLAAARSVARGLVFVSDTLRGSKLEQVTRGRRRGETNPSAVLTDRQLQVFRLLGEGRTTREVAESLDLSVKTVETHRANIMRSLRVRSAPELLRRAIEWTWWGGQARRDSDREEGGAG